MITIENAMNVLKEQGAVKSWTYPKTEDGEYPLEAETVKSKLTSAVDETYGRKSFLYLTFKTVKAADAAIAALLDFSENPRKGCHEANIDRAWNGKDKRSFSVQVHWWKGNGYAK